MPENRTAALLVTSPLEFADRDPLWKDQIRVGGFDRDRYLTLAREVEAAGFDGIFAADFVGVNRSTLAQNTTGPFRLGYAEPLTELTLLAAATSRIGLIGTFSTQFNEPYTIARQLSSLDTVSEGRAGWNLVTSFTGEQNYGAVGITTVAERYERAQEFLDVTRALWESWEPGSVVDGGDGRVRILPERIHDIDHHGAYFDVQQALDVAPSPQGTPVIVQAGASNSGLGFAARNAEIIFVAAPDLAAGLEFSTRVRALAREAGRADSDLRILPGVRIYLGDTEEQAREEYFSTLSEHELELAAEAVRGEIPDLDLTGLTLDDVLPIERFPSEESILASERRASRQLIYRRWVENGSHATVRDFLYRFATSFGHLQLIGTPESVADEITEWFRSGASDGFVLNGASSLEALTGVVFPLLRERGILAPLDDVTDAARTLRERLGTRPPVSAAVAAPAAGGGRR